MNPVYQWRISELFVCEKDIAQYRTISGDPYCNGFDKYEDVYSQVSIDSGATWETTATTPTLVEHNSPGCGYVPPTPASPKYILTLQDSSTVSGECDASSVITQDEVSAYTSTTVSVEIGECVTIIDIYTFFDFRSLTSVTIPNSVTSIDSFAFGNCTSLTSIDIPDSVTNIGVASFIYCQSLTSATIGSGVTSIGPNAFQDCSSLTSITVNATTPPTMTYSAFDNTNNCPIYVPCESISAYKTAWSDYANRIRCATPSSADYLTFVAQEAGTFSFSKSATTGNIQYSKNGGVWTQNTAVTVANGDVVKWKGEMTPNTGGYSYGIGTFSSTCRFVAGGNPMSLLFGDNFAGHTDLTGYDNAFFDLFFYTTGLTSIDKLVLPATTLSYGCYNEMFQGCASLTSVPKNLLPATTATNRCYQNMFRSCSSLTTAPDLPATTLDYRCYAYMFQDCTSLTTAPELPATILADRCYTNMFYNCSSLTKAPILSAATLTERCYYTMFRGCSSLNEIRCYATNISANNCTYNWVYNVASSGNFYKKIGMTAWQTGNSGIPSGWAITDYTG